MPQCVTCGHDVDGPPPRDVKRENECFPCSAGRLEIENERLRIALRQMLKEFDGIYNGRCRLCGGLRLYSAAGRPGKCERPECRSHRWRKALRRST